MTSRRISGLSSSGLGPLPTPSLRRWVEQRLLSDQLPTTLFSQLARQNLSDDKIPAKKVRNYLWNQPYISRFNEEGKKTNQRGTISGTLMQKRAMMVAGNLGHSVAGLLVLPRLSHMSASDGRGNHAFGIHKGQSLVGLSGIVRPPCQLGFHGKMMCCLGYPHQTHKAARLR